MCQSARACTRAMSAKACPRTRHCVSAGGLTTVGALPVQNGQDGCVHSSYTGELMDKLSPIEANALETHNSGVGPRNPVAFCAAVSEFVRLSLRLRRANRSSDFPIVGDADANVSLTSYGKRIATVWKTIESIGSGTVKPRRIILWLDDVAALADPPGSLKRLQARGLEIRGCPDYGPHKKYFPYLNDILPEHPGRTLVTADDDVYYPATWLQELLAAHRPDQVTAFRARIRNEGPYVEWALCDETTPSDTVFATGTSGVAYSQPVLEMLKKRGDEFIEICPRADDFWLHYATVASGLKVRQVRNTAALWWSTSLSKEGLWDGTGKANDSIAIRAREAWLND